MAISGAMTTIVASTVSMLTMPLLMRRLTMFTPDARSGGRMVWAAISGHPRRRAACHSPHQQASTGIDDDGHQEERSPDLDQRAQIHIVGGFAELIGQYAGH